MKAPICILTLLCLCLSVQALTLNNSNPQQNQTQVPITGSIVLMFNQNVSLSPSQSITLNGQACTPTPAMTYVIIRYSGLEYNHTYHLHVPEGSILSNVDQSPNTSFDLYFTTQSKPPVACKVVDFLVDPGAEPIYGKRGKTIASAIQAMPTKSASRYYVYIKNGIYNESFQLDDRYQNISIIGQNKDSVRIRHSMSPVVSIQGQHLCLENLSIENTADPNYNQYSIACYAEGKQNIYRNVRFAGHQDTKRTGGDRHYYKHCEIRGTIDFIYGDGINFYDSCNIYLEKRNQMMETSQTWDTAAVIVAGSHDDQATFGYVFNACQIDGEASNANRFSLGRPWHNAPRAVYLHTRFHILPFSYGWTSMGSSPPALYAEYNSMDAAGNPLDLSQREARFICGNDTLTGNYQPILSDEAAQAYNLRNVLSGNDAWKPDVRSQSPDAPKLITTNGATSQLIWHKDPNCICYLIHRNGQPETFVTDTSYTLESPGTYTVQSIGEYGFTSPTSEIVHHQPTSTPHIQKALLQIRWADHQLVLTDPSCSSGVVLLYDLYGTLLKRIPLLDGMATCRMEQEGLYLLKYQHHGYKIRLGEIK